MHSKYGLLITILTITSILGFTSCEDDQISNDSRFKLSFSTDTISFDTVFTSLGSATKKILVYNNNKAALKISEIKLSGGEMSTFRINVDGSKQVSNRFENIEILAKDSMFIFVSVKINPTNNNTPPLFIEDSITFNTNGNKQSIKLQAVGQDMHILKGIRYSTNTTLNADKPYLIYDSLIISKGSTLTLLPGARLYFHNNANLIIYGNLLADGTFEKPITLRGDRLDKIMFTPPFPYNNVAGQWGGIYLLGNSGNHLMNHVNMNSGYVGIYLNNDDRSLLPTLNITNCKIHNFLLYGLIIKNANATVVNSEISNTGSYSVYLSGGKHSFTHCTIANYFNNSNVQPTNRDKKPAVMIMNLNRTATMESLFQNCAIAGNDENEFSIATRYIELYKGKFDHCYIKSNSVQALSQFTNNRWYNKKDTIFKSIRYDIEKKTYFNFVPDSVSPIRGLADKNIATQYSIDLNGKSRITDNAPDAGAYEWKPTK